MRKDAINTVNPKAWFTQGSVAFNSQLSIISSMYAHVADLGCGYNKNPPIFLLRPIYQIFKLNGIVESVDSRDGLDMPYV